MFIIFGIFGSVFGVYCTIWTIPIDVSVCARETINRNNNGRDVRMPKSRSKNWIVKELPKKKKSEWIIAQRESKPNKNRSKSKRMEDWRRTFCTVTILFYSAQFVPLEWMIGRWAEFIWGKKRPHPLITQCSRYSQIYEIGHNGLNYDKIRTKWKRRKDWNKSEKRRRKKSMERGRWRKKPIHWAWTFNVISTQQKWAAARKKD